MVSYAERARKAQNVPNKPDPPPTAPPTSPPHPKQPVNVWNLRIEKMAAARAVSSSASSSAAPQAKAPVAEPPAPKKAVPQDDPFVAPSPSEASLRPAPAAVPPPAIPDPENWPEVGKAAPQGHPAPSDGSLSTSQSQPSTPSRRGEKTRWVPIPAEELQAAADAALKSRSPSQSHSRHRSNHPRNTNTTSSPLLNTASVLPHTRSQSGRTSANPSVSHSRVQSRAGSLQSSPRVPRTRRLPADEAPGPSTAVNASDAATSTSNYTLPPNTNPNVTYPSQPAVPTPPNGVYYPPPSSSAAIQSPPPPPSFHTSTSAFYPQGALNGSSSPLHHLTPPPGIGSPLSPSSPSTHPYAYPPMPMYAPYDYNAPGPSYAHGLNPYAPWHGHEYPPPPRHHLSGHQSPIYPPPPHAPPPQHFALHGQGQEGLPQHPESVNANGTALVPPPALTGPTPSTSSSTASGLVFGSISLDARSPDALAVPLPLSSVPSASSAVNGDVKVDGEGVEGSSEKEKPTTGVGKTFAIGVDANERAAGGSVPARLRAKAKAGTSAGDGVNGKEEKETAEVSSSPKKTRKAAVSASPASASTSTFTHPSAPASTSTSPSAQTEVKKWKFGTTSTDGSSVPATPYADRNLPLPPIANVVAGPSSLGLGLGLGHSVPPPAIHSQMQMQHSTTMPEMSGAMSPPMGTYTGSASFVVPRHTPPSASTNEGGEPSGAASSMTPPQTGPAGPTTTSTNTNTNPHALPDSDSDLEVKDYGRGFGPASGSGYASTVQAKEERLARLRRQQREKEWDFERMRREREMLPAGWVPEELGEVGAGWGGVVGGGGSGYAHGQQGQGYAQVQGQGQGQGHQRQHSGYGYAGVAGNGSGEVPLGAPELEGYAPPQGQEHQRQLSGYGYAGEEVPSVAAHLEGLSLSPGAQGMSRMEGDGVGAGAGPAYPPPPVPTLPPHTRGGPVEGVPPHSGSGRGRRGFRGFASERGGGERGERGRRGGRGANGYGGGRGFGSGGRGFGSRGGPQRQGPPPPQASSQFSVTPPPPHFQALPMLGAHEQGQHYYPPPRQQQQGPHSHYLPPPPNGYDYTSGAPPSLNTGSGLSPPSHLQHQHQQQQHQLPIPPPLPAPGAPGAPGVLGFGGAPLPPPQSTIPFPLDPVRYWLLGQLEYYLSPQNMAMDFFLRQRMDARGWIPIPLLASFNRVKMLTLDTQLVRDVLSLSQLVQVRGSMVRMGGWERFVLPDAKPSTVEEQPLPLVYQAQNMGFWEEGGYRLPEGGEQQQQGQGQGQGEQSQGVWREQSASATSQHGEEGHVLESSAENNVNGVVSPGAGGHAGANGGPPGLNGINKHAGDEEFEEEDEEEEVVFVMGEEAAHGGSWSPDRRS